MHRAFYSAGHRGTGHRGTGHRCHRRSFTLSSSLEFRDKTNGVVPGYPLAPSVVAQERNECVQLRVLTGDFF
jgi:hypothetical protein